MEEEKEEKATMRDGLTVEEEEEEEAGVGAGLTGGGRGGGSGGGGGAGYDDSWFDSGADLPNANLMPHCPEKAQRQAV